MWIIQWEEWGLSTDFIIYYLGEEVIFKYIKVKVKVRTGMGGSHFLWKVLKTFAVFWMTLMGERVPWYHEVASSRHSAEEKGETDVRIVLRLFLSWLGFQQFFCAQCWWALGDSRAAYSCFWSWSCRPSDKGHIHRGFIRKHAHK